MSCLNDTAMSAKLHSYICHVVYFRLLLFNAGKQLHEHCGANKVALSSMLIGLGLCTSLPLSISWPLNPTLQCCLYHLHSKLAVYQSTLHVHFQVKMNTALQEYLQPDENPLTGANVFQKQVFEAKLGLA